MRLGGGVVVVEELLTGGGVVVGAAVAGAAVVGAGADVAGVSTDDSIDEVQPARTTARTHHFIHVVRTWSNLVSVEP
ncbi:MAG: hypothetical protein ACI81L_003550 [Verrucomicrobiales bacterium]